MPVGMTKSFRALQPKRAQKVADFVAACALPKYFMLSEWKREAIANLANRDPAEEQARMKSLAREAKLRGKAAKDKRLAGDIQAMLDAADREQTFANGADRALASPYNRFDRLPLRRGRDGADPFSRRPEAPSEAHMVFVNALLKLFRTTKNHGPSGRSMSTRSATKSSSPTSIKFTGSRPATTGSRDEQPDGKFVESLRSKTALGKGSDSNQTNDKEESGDKFNRAASAATDGSLTARDDHCHLARQLKPRFAERLEAFRRQARGKNFLVTPKRVSKSSLSDSGAFRFSPLAAPVGVCGWSTHLAASASPRLSKKLPTFVGGSSNGVCASADVSGLQGKVGVRRVLSSTFGNVAEAFVAFDRLGTQSVALEEVSASLLELGMTKTAVSEALQDVTRGEDRMGAQDFMKVFSWHPLGSPQEQAELIAEAQSRRFAIITSLARAGASRRGMAGEMCSFSAESLLLSVIRKNLGPVRALFSEGIAASEGFKTDFAYEQTLTRDQFESGLRSIKNLGLSENDIVQAFDVFDVSRSGKITFAEIEQVYKADANAPLQKRLVAARPSSSGARTSVPRPPSGYHDRGRHRPHSAKAERPSAIVAAAKIRPLPTRPTTATSRMYTPRQRPLAAKSTGSEGEMSMTDLAPPETTSSMPKAVDPDALWRDGQKSLLLGRYDEAVSVLVRALELEPSHVGIMISYAKALIDGFSDFKGALELYQRAQSINPSDTHTLRLIGNLQRLGLKDVQAAEEQFQQALQIDPFCVDTLQDYADLKASNGDNKGALSLYRRILQEQADDPVASSELERLRTIVVRQQRQAQALQDNQGVKKSLAGGATSGHVVSGAGVGNDPAVEGIAGNLEENRHNQGEEEGAQAFTLNDADAEKAGLTALLLDWGDIQHDKIKLDSTSARLWMKRCMAKLEETLTMAESFHEVGDTTSESVFRRGFANLLKLFYRTEAVVKQGALAADRIPPGSKAGKSKQPQPQRVGQQAHLNDELNDFIAGRASEAESNLQKDLHRRSINDSVDKNFPSRVAKVPVRLHEIDLPDSVREAIQRQKYDGGAVNWRAGRVASRPSTAPRRRAGSPSGARPLSARHAAANQNT